MLPKTTTKPPKQCRGHELFDTCGSFCMDSCRHLAHPNKCPMNKCERGCFCIDGYFRGDEGHCVPQSECGVPLSTTPVSLLCPPGEQYNNCGKRCSEQCKGLTSKSRCSMTQCDQGCFCMSGLLRNDDGVCVPQKDCDKKMNTTKAPTIIKPKCKKNENYDICGNHCVESCEPPNACQLTCDSGCFCKKDFYRDHNGNCVPESDCPTLSRTTPKPEKSLECGKNEKYSECGQQCEQLCFDVQKNLVCPKRKFCVSGCFCIEGYLRDQKRDCVKIEDCGIEKTTTTIETEITTKLTTTISTCNNNEEYYSCGNHCIEMCRPPNACSIECKTGCFCSKGFYRNDKGVCVTEDECPDLPSDSPTTTPKSTRPIECGKNEEYSDCGSRCGQSCVDQFKKLTCPMRKVCISGCFCLPGFYRDDAGDCVPFKKCNPSDEKPSSITPITPVLITTTPSCKENEHFDNCGDHCIELCQSPDACEQSCESGCFCDKGYYRAQENKPCIPESECPQNLESTATPRPFKCENNEEYSDCGTRCGQMCSDIEKQIICPKNRHCVSGCFCLPGFYRNDQGHCVPSIDCPDIKPPSENQIKCDENEEYNKCGNGCGQSCEEQIRKKECPKNSRCTAGCFCIEGYFKNEFGNCVPQKQCPNYNLTLITKKPEKLTTKRTRPSTTTTTPKCPKLTEHETKCGSRCKESCKSIVGIKEERLTCPKSQCEDGCFCNEGLYRDKYGQCLPKDQCDCDLPPEKCSGPNEEYSACGRGCGVTCAQLNNGTVKCPEICGRGCFCTKGNLRNKDGICVPPRECGLTAKPGQSPDSPDEERDSRDQDIGRSLGRSVYFNCGYGEKFSKCGHHCGETCQELISPIECPKECEAGCFCKKGLYRDSQGNCGPKDNCDNLTKTEKSVLKCSENEEYSECGNSCSESCEDMIMCSTGCERGCFCVDSYLRNKDGKCVPENQCKDKEQCKACKPNEYYTNCGSDCGNTCSDLDQSVSCPQVCNKGCFCQSGFFRSSSGDCVPRSQC